MLSSGSSRIPLGGRGALGQTPAAALAGDWIPPGQNDMVDIRAGATLRITNAFSVGSRTYVNTSENSLEARLPEAFRSSRARRLDMKRGQRHTGRDVSLEITLADKTVSIPLTEMTPDEILSMRDILISVLEMAHSEAVNRQTLIREVVRNGYSGSSIVKRLYRKLPVLHGEPRLQREYGESLRNGLERIVALVQGGGNIFESTRGTVRRMAEPDAAALVAAHTKAADELIAQVRKARGNQDPSTGLPPTGASEGDTAPTA